jgi:hypothetical protein
MSKDYAYIYKVFPDTPLIYTTTVTVIVDRSSSSKVGGLMLLVTASVEQML